MRVRRKGAGSESGTAAPPTPDATDRLRSLPVPLLLVDGAAHVVWANAAARRLVRGGAAPLVLYGVAGEDSPAGEAPWQALRREAADGNVAEGRYHLRGGRGRTRVPVLAAFGKGADLLILLGRGTGRGRETGGDASALHSLVKGLPDPIFSVDRSFRLLALNRAASALAGSGSRRVVGGICHEVLFRRDEPCEGCRLAEAMDRRRPIPGRPIEMGTPGAERAFDRLFVPLPDDEHGGRVLELLRDRSMEARLRHRLTATEQHARVGRIAASIAHDLRSSLLVISAAAESLREQVVEERALELRGIILDEVRHLDVFSRDLLEFSGVVAVRRRTFDLAVIVDHAVAGLDHLRKDLDLHVGVEISPALPRVCADPESIRRALTNVLANAMQFAGHRGRVHVAAAAEGDRVCIRIEDDGPGVTRDIQGDIFEPFFTTRPGGSGLGLANAKRFVELNGGTIVLARPRLLPGAAFELRLESAPEALE